MIIPLATVEDADAYFATKLHSEAWNIANSDDKLLALIEGTRIINRFEYISRKTVETQENEWPRLDYETIPAEILYALFEFSYALLDGVDPERELKGLRVTSRGYSAVRTTYDPTSVPEWIVAGVPSAMGWLYLRPFLRNSGTIKLHRVS